MLLLGVTFSLNIPKIFIRIYGGNLIKQKLYLIKPEKTLLCFNQTIAMLHLSIRILQCCNSHSFPSHISMCFFHPTQKMLICTKDSQKLFTIKTMIILKKCEGNNELSFQAFRQYHLHQFLISFIVD